MLLFRLVLPCSVALLVLRLGAQSHSEHQEAPVAIVLGANVATRASQSPTGRISAELLRYPLSAKARAMLQKALRKSESGDHMGAIREMRKTLAKCPGTEAYVSSLLGVEYLKTLQFPEAIDTLEQAVKLLPHDASNHANLGLSLMAAGEYDRAEPELRRALELDPHNPTATRLINGLATGQTARK